MLDKYAKSDLELMIGEKERILWRGRPNKKCYVLESIFNPMLPLALIWFLIDVTILSTALFSATHVEEGVAKPPAFILISYTLFILFHMMPFWIYLAGVLTVIRKYKHTEYILTDKGVYTSGGVLAYTCKMKPYTEISRIFIHRGIFDQFLKVADIVFSSKGNIKESNSFNDKAHDYQGNLTIADIPEYHKVFELAKKLQTDVFADTMYPNDLRPEENHGYNTEYKGL